MDEIRIGIWGCGFIGRTHARNLSKLPGVRICAVACQPTETEAARSLLAEAGNPQGAVLNDPLALVGAGCQAVVVGVPPGVRGRVAQALADKGLHLFLEKPLALDLASVQAIAAACARQGVVAQAGFHYRAGAAVRWAKQSATALGRPTLYEGRFWMNIPGDGWWSNPALSGGQVVEQLIHQMDLGVHLFGPVRAVTSRQACVVKGDKPSYRVEDSSVTLLHFVSGALGVVTGSNAATPDRFIGDWRAVWEHAVVDAPSDGDWRSTEKARVQWAADRGPVRETLTQDYDRHAALAANWVAAIRGKETLLAPVSEAVHSHAIAFAAVASKGVEISL